METQGTILMRHLILDLHGGCCEMTASQVERSDMVG